MSLRTSLVIVLVAILAGAAGFFGLLKGPEDAALGAQPGTDFYQRVSFFDGFEFGGKYTSVSTTSATYTLSASQFRSGAVDVESTATGAALTLSLPASTTDAYPRTPGMRASLIVKNSHTAAATTTTIAAGTGIDLQEPDGQNVVIGINNYAVIDCLRLDTFDVACVVDETIPAD